MEMRVSICVVNRFHNSDVSTEEVVLLIRNVNSIYSSAVILSLHDLRVLPVITELPNEELHA